MPSLLYFAKYIESLRCLLSECELSKLTGLIQVYNWDQRQSQEGRGPQDLQHMREGGGSWLVLQVFREHLLTPANKTAC
jgi:hypothetical protein